MTFLAPTLLFALLLVPVLAALYVWTQRRRSRYAVRFTNLDLLANLAPSRPGWRRHLPAALYLLAVSALAIGLARPTMIVPTPRDDATVILAIDISGSMKAEDVAPTRLDAARSAAQDFVDGLPASVRVGLVAFATRPVTLVAPTADRAAVRAAIDGLTPRDGTAMGDALMQVLDLAEAVRIGRGATAPVRRPATPRPVATPRPARLRLPAVAAILLSDGANSAGDTEPLDAAQRAASLGVPIYTIALGTAAGTVEVTDENGMPVTLDVPPDTAHIAADRRDDGRDRLRCPDRGRAEGGLRRSRVARRLDRRAAGGDLALRRRRTPGRRRGGWLVRALVRPAALAARLRIPRAS